MNKQQKIKLIVAIAFFLLITGMSIVAYIKILKPIRDTRNERTGKFTLSEKYPDLFVSQYERVTFSTRDYAEALAFGELNDRVLEAIIQNKWEEKLDDRGFVETLFLDHK